MTTPFLRAYQTEAVLAIRDAWSEGIQRPAVILPTGAGKTRLFTALCVIEEASYRRRPVILVARDELVRQTVAAFKLVKREHQKIGVVQGSLDESPDSHIVVASVQTLSRASRLARFDPKRFDLIICDEAHWTDSPSWRRVLEHFGAFDETSGTRVMGCTATMTRSGKHKLGEIWQEIVYERDVRWAIEQGFLVPVSAQQIVLPDLDMSKVRTQHGDLSEADLGKALSDAKAGPIIAEAYNNLARNEDGELRRGIVFTPTIATAEAFLLDFRAAGIPSELVIGSTPIAERQAAYDATKRGVNKVLMSVAVLTTGFDLPAVEVAVMARPTKQRGLYIQCVGRALRLSPETGKTEALILDCVGSSRLGLASVADLRIHEDPEPREPGLDPMTGLMLRQPAPDVSPEQLTYAEIDPFSGLRRITKGKTIEKFKKTYKITSRGTLYLPDPDGYIALHHQSDGLWTVCEVPTRGSTTCHERDLKLADAMCAAMARYTPAPKRHFSGPATPDQIMYLVRLGVEFDADSLTKAQASDLIETAKASKRLDR